MREVEGGAKEVKRSSLSATADASIGLKLSQYGALLGAGPRLRVITFNERTDATDWEGIGLQTPRDHA